jgi:hypothetical protein
MSDLLEKMCKAFWVASKLGDYWDDMPKRSKEEIGHTPMRAALTLLTKPENISASAVEAFWATLGAQDAAKINTPKAIAAAIASALQDNTEEKKTS